MSYLKQTLIEYETKLRAMQYTIELHYIKGFKESDITKAWLNECYRLNTRIESLKRELSND